MTLHSSVIPTGERNLFRVYVWVDSKEPSCYMVERDEARHLYPKITHLEVAIHKVARNRFREENVNLDV